MKDFIENSQFIFNLDDIYGPFCLFCGKKIEVKVKKDENNDSQPAQYITQCSCKGAKKEQSLIDNLKKANQKLQDFYNKKRNILEKNKIKIKTKILKDMLKNLKENKDIV